MHHLNMKQTPCNHEEADSRMMLHVAHAARHGNQRILVCTVDTDVVVLSVMVAQKLSCQYEIWLHLEQERISILRSPRNGFLRGH